jgi:uncharacterized protein DUF1707
VNVSHLDREHLVEVLKAAFVQGRLTKDEFDLRVGKALAAAGRVLPGELRHRRRHRA